MMIPAVLQSPVVTASDTALAVALGLMVAGALALLSWSILDGHRTATWIPILAFAGGVIALPIESFWDVNVQFMFATNSHPIAFTAFGRHIPLYLACIYPAFIGWGSYLGYRLISAEATRRQLLLLPAAFFAADAIIEVAGATTNLWDYYGHHAWNPFDWPIYFGVLNGTITLIGGWLLVIAHQRLHGITRPLCVLAVPTAYAGIYAIAGWPTWAALNAEVPAVVVWAAGAATIVIASGICWLIADAAAVTTRAAAEGQRLPGRSKHASIRTQPIARSGMTRSRAPLD
jgi:hypothetical protein